MKINPAILQKAAKEILLACGETAENAAAVVDCMLQADMRGITTHGTYLLGPVYKRAQVKQLVLPTKITITEQGQTAVVIDGGDGLGAVAGRKAVELAVERAKKFGSCAVFIRNTNNVGSLACYTEAAAKQGTVAFMCCNAAPAMSPWGGSQPYIGTNPIAIAFYTGSDILFSADMASSVVARGKIRKAARNGQKIPVDWAMDEDGNFTTNPDKALNGCLLPIAGPKGSAIALAVDILCGLLCGSQYARNLKSFHELEGSTGVGAFMNVIDVETLMPIEKYRKLFSGYIAEMKGLKKAKGVEEIYLPGEIEQNREKQSRISGIELDDTAVAALNEMLVKTGSEIRLTE
jgi:LDH2 family malate/lactate/ureidoglycolate dehydrogenase